MKLTINEIAAACGGQLHGTVADSIVQHITIDSRQVQQGSLFIPLKGERADGHKFIPGIWEKGAVCTLTEQYPETSEHPFIQVASCHQALGDIAGYYRSLFSIPVIGVTGSVGKTSSKEMIASVLSQKFNIHKTAGNFNNEIGLPLTIFGINETHKAAILEMGINQFGEMHRLSKMAKPDICTFTNIGPCHLEFLIDLDGVYRAKSEIFDFISKDGQIFFNGDDTTLRKHTDINGIRPVFYGLNDESDIFADKIKSHGLKGTSCEIHLNGETFPVRIPIPGEHMVYNALAGTAIGAALGLSTEEIMKGIESIAPVGGRNRQIDTDYFTIIDDCYNANPVSMKASLNVLAKAENRQIAILGSMGELGPGSEDMHKEVGAHAAKLEIDLIVCIGAQAKPIGTGAETVHSPSHVLYYTDKEHFIKESPSILQQKDVILVKASHSNAFEEIVTYLEQI